LFGTEFEDLTVARPRGNAVQVRAFEKLYRPAPVSTARALVSIEREIESEVSNEPVDCVPVLWQLVSPLPNNKITNKGPSQSNLLLLITKAP